MVTLDKGQFFVLSLFGGVLLFVAVTRFLVLFGSRSPISPRVTG